MKIEICNKNREKRIMMNIKWMYNKTYSKNVKFIIKTKLHIT